MSSYLYLYITSHDFIKTYTPYNKILYTVNEMLQHYNVYHFESIVTLAPVWDYVYIPSFQQTWTLHLIYTSLELFVLLSCLLFRQLKIILIREHLAPLSH